LSESSVSDALRAFICERQTAENGDIVAAMLNDEATVKVFKQRDGKTWLLPRNSAYEPIDGESTKVSGSVAVIRSVR
jgi:repressor LexA